MVGQKIQKLREVARIAGDGVRAQTVFDGKLSSHMPHCFCKSGVALNWIVFDIR